MRRAASHVWECVQPSVLAAGCRLLGVEYGQAGHGGLLRVYIDKPDGVSMEDCVQVTELLSVALDVADPIRDPYELEVSSPGWDRPLFCVADFQQFVGHEVRVRTTMPIAGRRRYRGIIKGGNDGKVQLEVDGEVVELRFVDIEEARLVPDPKA